jgi:hypothetical protein
MVFDPPAGIVPVQRSRNFALFRRITSAGAGLTVRLPTGLLSGSMSAEPSYFTYIVEIALEGPSIVVAAFPRSANVEKPGSPGQRATASQGKTLRHGILTM